MLVTPSGIVNEERLLQPRNNPLGIDVIPSGRFTDERLLQYEKAPLPMLVTLLGMSSEESLEQLLYLEVIDYQLFVVNTVEKWIGCYLWVYGK